MQCRFTKLLHHYSLLVTILLWNVSIDGAVTCFSDGIPFSHCSLKERETMIASIRMWNSESLSMIVLGWLVYMGQVLAASPFLIL